MDVSTLQRRILANIHPMWLPMCREILARCEERRALATYDTGTISVAAMLYLKAICREFAPVHAIEVGTFIGTSTEVLASEANRVYTCDKDNDCLESTDAVRVFQKTRSTKMLADLAEADVVADLVFFDGRIQLEDLPLIFAVTTPATVFAFDDFQVGDKGELNVARLHPWLKRYHLVPPPADIGGVDEKTNIALLVPECRL